MCVCVSVFSNQQKISAALTQFYVVQQVERDEDQINNLEF